MHGMERLVHSSLDLAENIERKLREAQNAVKIAEAVIESQDRELEILRRMVEIAAEYAYRPPVATTKEETMKAFMDQWREQAEREVESNANRNL